MNPIAAMVRLLGRRARQVMPGVFVVVAPSPELGPVHVWRVAPRIVLVARPRKGEEKTASQDVGERVRLWLLRAVG